MNIELRFKEKHEEVLEFSGCYGEAGTKVVKTIRILQYRNTFSDTYANDWEDVPCVGVDDD